jgi:arylsulfatase A
MRVAWLCVVSIALTACAAAAPRARAAERPPNVVFILADDLGWGDVGFNGRKDWPTPNLDRLASQGTVFSRWYTAGVTCAPSRAALMTGKYPIHCGVSANNQDLPASEVTVAEALKARGYATGLFGKWHHGRPRPGADAYVHPMDQGFDEFFGFTDATAAHQQYPRTLWDGREERPVSGYANMLFTDRGIDFLKRHRERPFFLYMPYTLSHFRIEAPPEDVEPFRGKFKERDPADPANATYAAMVTRLDKEVGRLLAALDEVGLTENTLVVFTSDHGATFEGGNKGTSAYHKSNGPFRGQKRTLWEGGVRVPAAVRWPGKVPAGKESGEVVHMTDVLPTLLAAAGGTPEAAWKVDGRNVLDVWRSLAAAPQRTLFWEWRAEGYHQLAAVRGNLKLVITGNTAPELFDVEADPAEMRSVHAEHPELVKQLQDELKAWIATEAPDSKDRDERPARRRGVEVSPGPTSD